MIAQLTTISRRLLLAFGLSSTLVLVACGQSDNGAGAGAPPPTLVKFVQVNPENAAIFSKLEGRVAATENAQIRARVTGIVHSINFKQGSQVKKGDLLFTIDPATYQAAVNQAKASLAQAQAAARTARSLANRYAPLVKIAAVSKQDYEAAIGQANQAVAAVASAKAALDSAQINLAYTQVRSPINGIIGQALVTKGALVSSTEGTELAVVQNFNEVYVDFSQSVGDLIRMRKAFASGALTKADSDSASVDIMLEDGSVYEHKGKLLFTGAAVDESTGQVTLRASVTNPEGTLLPGMFVQIKLEQGNDQKALLVPSQALQHNSDGLSQVYVVTHTKDKDGKETATIVNRNVDTGGVDGPRTMITKGLQAGDQVIVEGYQKVRPGQAVTPVPWDKDPKTGASLAPQNAGQAAAKTPAKN